MTERTKEGASPWLFLLGLVAFLGSAVLFAVALVLGVDVLRSIVANAAAAVILIGWAALDTLRDPDSEVATVGGATGTALLLYGLYLFGAGVVIAVTGLFAHAQLTLGLLYVGLALAATVLGYLIFPTGSVIDGGASEEREAGEDTGPTEDDDDRST